MILVLSFENRYHFTAKQTGLEKLSNLFKDTELLRVRIRI